MKVPPLTRQIKILLEYFFHRIKDMNTNNNPFEPYCAAAFRAAIASCYIGGKISEQQIDFIKETISRFRETEIDQSAFSNTVKEEMKFQWKQWLDATTHGIKDELRAEGKLV